MGIKMSIQCPSSCYIHAPRRWSSGHFKSLLLLIHADSTPDSYLLSLALTSEYQPFIWILPEIRGPHEWHRQLRMESQCSLCRWPCSSRAAKAGSSSWGNERLQYTGTHLTNPEGPASPCPHRGQSIQRNGGTGVKHPDTEVCMKEMSHLIPNVETKSP